MAATDQDHKELTIEQKVDLLKKKHKVDKVYVAKVPTEDGNEAIAYLRKPDRQTLGAVMHRMQQDQVQALELLLNGCWIDGDERIINDDDLFFAVAPKLSELMTFKNADLQVF